MLAKDKDVNNTLETCYMCERAPSSTEHVPPKCLFPEKKDIGSDLFRKNLITVLSCLVSRKFSVTC